MKRLILFYSLNGSTRAAAQKLAAQLGADVFEIRPRKPMPQGRASQILYGGMLCTFGFCPPLAETPPAADGYDEIILGTPVWAGKCAAPVKTLLRQTELRPKITSVFTFSGSGDDSGCLKQLRPMLPSLRHTAALLDPSAPQASENDEKLSALASAISAHVG